MRDNDLTVRPEDYLRLVLKKTAWYSFIHPMRIGALVANGDDRKLDRFDRFGFLLGAAFQITDDVLNLIGDVARYGKEINGDLLEGKRTIVLAHALGKVNATDRAWIGNFLSRPRERRLTREVLQLRQILGEYRQYRVGSAIGCRIRRSSKAGVRRDSLRRRARGLGSGMAAQKRGFYRPAKRVALFRRPPSPRC